MAVRPIYLPKGSEFLLFLSLLHRRFPRDRLFLGDFLHTLGFHDLLQTSLINVLLDIYTNRGNTKMMNREHLYWF